MAFTFKDGKLTKVDEEKRQAAYSPSSPQSKAVRSGGGGKGSGKNMEFKDGSPSDDQRKRILASQNDRSFGYFDMNTGNYVPWYIDIQDGGGMNTSGDTFQGAGLYSAALNLANVAPYGYNRPRTYAQAGMQNRPTGLPPSPPQVNELQSDIATTVLPPANTMNTDANMGVGSMPRNNMVDPNPMMTIPQIQKMVEPLIQGLLQQEYQQVQPMDMIAKMREEEMRRRNQPPTLLS
ncbi:MAG: hypothetical protein CL498_03890 [Actinobacteria bacterium]|nr:hypothetical protein [Actinomycetota bacterium]|tara:strand:- start:5074 stop:5778 length:705 start_codon:yes stop_codon:yes gene_type:complete